MIFDRITKIIVATTELIEAEGENLRHRIYGLMLALFLMVLASIVSLAGAYMLFHPLFSWIESFAGTSGAYLICGSLALLIAGALLWKSRKLIK